MVVVNNDSDLCYIMVTMMMITGSVDGGCGNGDCW